MIDPVTASLILGGLNMGMGALGASSAARARRAAEARRKALMSDYMQGADANLQTLRDRNARSLWTATGSGADALTSAASGLGDRMANAGVYNSSATAGAVARGQSDLMAQLANLAANNFASEAQMAGQNRLDALRMSMDANAQALAQAQANEAANQGGMMQGMMTLGGGLLDKYAVAPAAPSAAGAPNAPVAAPVTKAPKATDLYPAGTVQSIIQQQQQAGRAALGMTTPAALPMTNGTINQNGLLPTQGKRKAKPGFNVGSWRARF